MQESAINYTMGIFPTYFCRYYDLIPGPPANNFLFQKHTACIAENINKIIVGVKKNTIKYLQDNVRQSNYTLYSRKSLNILPTNTILQ